MPTVWLLWLFLAFYALPGLGHDPWKNEPWLLHVLSGLPAGLPTAWGAQLQAFATRLYLPLIEAGGALSGWLGLTAWRLPSALLLTLACVALYRAARVFYGRERAAAAPLLLCGAFGLIVRAHASEPILVWLALVALLLWAFAASPRRAGPVMVILLILGVGASIAAHWMRMPDFAFDFSGYGAALFKLIRLLPLLSWPLWPLALWSLWRFRRQRREPGYVLPVAAFVLALFIVPMGFVPGRMEEALMLLLPPMALIAAPGALALRRGAANGFDWFSGMIFSGFAILLWVGWSAMVFGVPARLAGRSAVLMPGFEGVFSLIAFLCAVLVSLLWIAQFRLPRSPWRCLTRWCGGFLTVWLLAVCLWQPWIEYGKSYRQVAALLKAALPEGTPCVFAPGIGYAQRASLSWFIGIRFEERHACPLLLVSSDDRLPPSAAPALWTGNRAGDRSEHFWLYRANPD